MAQKERFQNPVVGDDVRLRLFSYNSNNSADFNEVVQVEIFFLDPDERTEANPDGRRLVETIAGSSVSRTNVGEYEINITLADPSYTIGNYTDIWTVRVEANDSSTAEVANKYQVYPDLWYTTPIPIVYDFNFSFRPNKMRQGSKRFLIIDIVPNVPTTTDLKRYYENLAIVSPLRISIEQNECGPGTPFGCESQCIPTEEDLRLLVDCEEVTLREKTTGFYFIDTTDLPCGVYNVWFTMEFGDSTYISDKQQLQIF